MIGVRHLAIALALAVNALPASANAQLRAPAVARAQTITPERDPANSGIRDQIAPPSLGSCLDSRLPCVTPVAAATRRPSRNPLVAVPMDPHQRTRVLRGALIGGLAGFVLVGLYGTVKSGLCDAARCPNAGTYTLFGTLGGAALGALAGAADP
jgi:hypothetical protein